MPFERTFHVSWAQLDSNAHMANTAFLDMVVDVRFMFFCRGPAETLHALDRSEDFAPLESSVRK